MSVTDISHEIGIEEEVMQELLLRFEQRIFERLDSIESRMNDRMSEHESEINVRLDEILELLKWKGPDEPLD